MDGEWRCPECKVKAEVMGKKIVIYITGRQFPKHFDCEFGKAIKDIDFSKLEKIG